MGIVGEGVLDMLVTYGRHKSGDEYSHLLENIKPDPDFRKIQGVLGI